MLCIVDSVFPVSAIYCEMKSYFRNCQQGRKVILCSVTELLGQEGVREEVDLVAPNTNKIDTMGGYMLKGF